MEIPEYRESKGDHTSLLHPYSVTSAGGHGAGGRGRILAERDRE